MSNTLSTREKLDDLYTLKIGLSNVQWIVQMHRINEEGQKYVNILNKYGLNQLSEKITSYSQSELTLEERTQLKEELLVDIETLNNKLTKIINGTYSPINSYNAKTWHQNRQQHQQQNRQQHQHQHRQQHQHQHRQQHQHQNRQQNRVFLMVFMVYLKRTCVIILKQKNGNL